MWDVFEAVIKSLLEFTTGEFRSYFTLFIPLWHWSGLGLDQLGQSRLTVFSTSSTRTELKTVLARAYCILTGTNGLSDLPWFVCPFRPRPRVARLRTLAVHRQCNLCCPRYLDSARHPRDHQILLYEG
jgi:hypothetical protein